MSNADSKATVRKPRQWGRLLLKLFIFLIVTMIGFYFAAPSGVGWIIGHKLKGELADRMKARLDFSRVVYEFPYGVRVEKAHLLLPGGDTGPGSWVDVGRLELTLAKLPVGTGPLVIEKLDIDKPRVRLSASYSAPASTESPATVTPAVNQKLSDLFQLRSITVSGGQFEYDVSKPGHPVDPIVWGHLDAKMNTQPAAAGTYNFSVAVQDEPIVVARANGSFDIDGLQLNLDKFNVTVTADPTKRPAQVPPQVLDLIARYQVGGQLVVEGRAQMPLKSLYQTTYTANLSLNNVHCKPPGFAGPILPSEFTIASTNTGGACTFNLAAKDQELAELTATGTVRLEDLMLDLTRLHIVIHCDPNRPIRQIPAELAGTLHKIELGGQLELEGSARLPVNDPQRGLFVAQVDLQNGTCRFPGWSGPVSPARVSFTTSNVAGVTAQVLPRLIPVDLPAQPSEAHIWLHELSAKSGNQLLRLIGGEITFDPVRGTWEVRKIQGSADVGDGPGPLEDLDSRFIIPFVIAGNGKRGDDTSGVRFALDDGSAVITRNHVRVNRINGMLTATSTGITSTGLVAKCCEGEIKASVSVDWKGQVPASAQVVDSDPADRLAALRVAAATQPAIALAYWGQFELAHLDLHQLAMQYTTDPAIRQKAFGQLDWHQTFRGSMLSDGPESGPDSAADRLSGQGNFDVAHGYFMDVPILKNIVMAMNMEHASTVGEAAAIFEINRSVITFNRMQANSPVLGVDGQGRMGFDRKVNMEFVATPLADWQKDAKSAGMIDQAQQLIGQAQNAIDKAQRQLYTFRVSGDAGNPNVDAVAIPALSDSAPAFFSKMAGTLDPNALGAGLKKLQDGDKPATGK